MGALAGVEVLPAAAPTKALSDEGQSRTRSLRPVGADVTPDDVAAGMEAALRLRAPGIHASTPLVVKLAVRVCRQLDLAENQVALVDACARVRDIGMVALPDAVVTSTEALTPEHWEILNRHPILGAELLQSLPATAAMAPIVRAHHERWDGNGYPDQLKGPAIPLLSRVLAACDAFVAIAMDRPHRRGIGAAGALDHVCQEREKQLDPRVVDALANTIIGGNAPDSAQPHPSPSAEGSSRNGQAPATTGTELKGAIIALKEIPAFELACERALASIDRARGTVNGEAVAAIESDVGLTVAVLRAAQTKAGRRAVTNVPDAVLALSPSEIVEAIDALPRISFPWRTQSEATMHRFRIHTQAVVRAAERIARALTLHSREELVTAALLHDIGKLVLAAGDSGDPIPIDATTMSPEERVRREATRFGVDHASLGSLLLERWGLHASLARAVAEHHSAEADSDIGGLVRLADMAAHYAHGDAVDRRTILRLSSSFGLPLNVLREILFDLPHAGGSHRSRAQASPLSKRETAALQLLAEGKHYKQIAVELGVSASTIRTHLHNVYAKLEVDDRAQAVLRAAEMAWI